MKLNELIEIADSGFYQKGLIKRAHEGKCEEGRDYLAKFIAQEIKETFDENEEDEELQVGVVMRSLERSMDEIKGVIDAIAQ